jgi:hypothetical protein
MKRFSIEAIDIVRNVKIWLWTDTLEAANDVANCMRQADLRFRDVEIREQLGAKAGKLVETSGWS